MTLPLGMNAKRSEHPLGSQDCQAPTSETAPVSAEAGFARQIARIATLTHRMLLKRFLPWIGELARRERQFTSPSISDRYSMSRRRGKAAHRGRSGRLAAFAFERRSSEGCKRMAGPFQGRDLAGPLQSRATRNAGGRRLSR